MRVTAEDIALLETLAVELELSRAVSVVDTAVVDTAVALRRRVTDDRKAVAAVTSVEEGTPATPTGVVLTMIHSTR